MFLWYRAVNKINFSLFYLTEYNFKIIKEKVKTIDFIKLIKTKYKIMKKIKKSVDEKYYL